MYAFTGFPAFTPTGLRAFYDWDVAGTYDIEVPGDASYALVYGSGGHGGGGSGRKGLAATVRCGGGGGASGSAFFIPVPLVIPNSMVPRMWRCIVGTGGTPGAAVTANSTNGNAGGSGTETSISTWDDTNSPNWGLFVPAGGGGAGGTATLGTGGTAAGGMYPGSAGGSASGTGGAGVAPSVLPAVSGWFVAQGASSGGGITSANAASAGGNGNASINATWRGVAPTGGANTGGVGTPVQGYVEARREFMIVALAGIVGAPGGGANLSGAAGKGSDGYRGPGAGGGASVDATGDSGAGGTGSAGRIVIAFW